MFYLLRARSFGVLRTDVFNMFLQIGFAKRCLAAMLLTLMISPFFLYAVRGLSVLRILQFGRLLCLRACGWLLFVHALACCVVFVIFLFLWSRSVRLSVPVLLFLLLRMHQLSFRPPLFPLLPPLSLLSLFLSRLPFQFHGFCVLLLVLFLQACCYFYALIVLMV